MAITDPSILERLQRARTARVKAPYKGPAKQSEKAKAKVAEEKKNGKPASKIELDKWFFDIAEKHSVVGFGVCMECGALIPKAFMRHATAHLLAKKLFPTVATHPLNYLILGAGCGCHNKTHTVTTFIKMDVWPKAAAQIKEMIPLLPVDELRQISNQLLNAIDKTIL